jgi:hypothetical protein
MFAIKKIIKSEYIGTNSFIVDYARKFISKVVEIYVL